MGKSTHLWEPKHAYYCEESGYYSGTETVNEYPSWEAFVEAEGDADPDYNLLFRWDWDKVEKTLRLFWIAQRKGYFRCTLVRAMHPDEEDEVRFWLKGRWNHLHALWAPVSAMPVVATPQKSAGEDSHGNR